MTIPYHLKLPCIKMSSIMAITLTLSLRTSFETINQWARSSEYSSSINEPSLTSSIKTCIPMTSNSGLRAAPWWTPIFTEKEYDSSPSTATAVLQIWCSITTPIYQIFWDTFLPQSWLNNFSWHLNSLFKIKKYKKQLLVFRSKFFSMSSQNKHRINSVFPQHKSVFYLVDIYQLMQLTIQNLFIKLESML